MRETTKTPTTSLKELRASVVQNGETIPATSVSHSSPVKAVRQSENERATVEKSSHEILPGIFPKACGKLRGKLKKGFEETQVELFEYLAYSH